ncbi:alkylation response protein AidB-like acyl-CoA dehydrogenase [Chelatococcus asaccharovorans]|uniref:Alkylation response protein AidB-like acyl-CoA dehydrogenase n=2 Tax=Chelatococcus asaccharovorans TaxID=28210 RepID=A0A2V3UBV1_9HYPH|nr:acyl-CoA dehydrogenase family protein [Chelatococcus asaccharovorans]PXW61994.1 alkylation response protein AidB-like acyl-CoA dehydrogenase [Chelatococcus asaccharovorans]
MDFDFNQEQYMFQDTVRDLLASALTMEHLRSGTPAELWGQLAETGVFALLTREEDGGLGLGYTDLALIFEEFGRALVPAPIAAAIVAGGAIARFGTPEQRAQLLPGHGEGALRLSSAFAETVATVPAAMTLTARPTDAGWTVTGSKILVPDAAAADKLLVALRFGDDLGLALVEPSRAGVTLREQDTLDLTARYHEVIFDHVTLTAGDIVGGRPDPAAVVACFDAAAAVAALQMTGMAARTLDEAVTYVGQRKQFDRVIGSFQAIKHRCADMAVAVDACRSAAYYAAWALDEAAPDERARAVSMAKSWCGDNARFTCNQAIQLHGGIGFTWELGLHLFLRRIKCEEASFGDADWHRERVIGATLRSMELAG